MAITFTFINISELKYAAWWAAHRCLAVCLPEWGTKHKPGTAEPGIFSGIPEHVKTKCPELQTFTKPCFSKNF